MPLQSPLVAFPHARGSRAASGRRTDDEIYRDWIALCRLAPTRVVLEEGRGTMASAGSRANPLSPPGCEAGDGAWPAAEGDGSIWSTVAAERADAKSRYLKLATTLESDVIPRLLQAHPRGGAVAIGPDAVEQFVELLRSGSDAEVEATVRELVHGGVGLDVVFGQLLAPAARRLGELWESDRCDFSTITICLGQLQRVLREWSPVFGREVRHPPNGRRVLLAQHPQEQHSFGLSLVAEYFRRDGWEVLGGIGGAVADAPAQVARDWFDTLGFSIGSESRLDWLQVQIRKARVNSKNRSLVVLVGGPLFVIRPDLAAAAGADALCCDAASAAVVADDLLSNTFQRP